jgi:hypothetical protein
MFAKHRFRCLQLFCLEYKVSEDYFSKFDTPIANNYKIYKYLPEQLFYLVLSDPEGEEHNTIKSSATDNLTTQRNVTRLELSGIFPGG